MTNLYPSGEDARAVPSGTEEPHKVGARLDREVLTSGPDGKKPCGMMALKDAILREPLGACASEPRVADLDVLHNWTAPVAVPPSWQTGRRTKLGNKMGRSPSRQSRTTGSGWKIDTAPTDSNRFGGDLPGGRTRPQYHSRRAADFSAALIETQRGDTREQIVSAWALLRSARKGQRNQSRQIGTENKPCDSPTGRNHTADSTETKTMDRRNLRRAGEVPLKLCVAPYLPGWVAPYKSWTKAEGARPNFILQTRKGRIVSSTRLKTGRPDYDGIIVAADPTARARFNERIGHVLESAHAEDQRTVSVREPRTMAGRSSAHTSEAAGPGTPAAWGRQYLAVNPLLLS